MAPILYKSYICWANLLNLQVNIKSHQEVTKPRKILCHTSKPIKIYGDMNK